MDVRVELFFDPPDAEAWKEMESLGRYMTNAPGSVRVSVPEEASPGWLSVEFTMRTEAQYKALEKLEYAIETCTYMALDSVIYFPKPPRRAKAPRKRTV